MKQIWKYVKLLIGIVLIVWLLLRVDLNEVWLQLRNGDWIWMIPLLVLFLSSLLLISPIKLHLLVGGVANYRFRTVFDATLIGLFFNNFLPTNIGGDVVKGYFLKRRGPLKWAEIITAILTERITGLLVLAGAFLVYLIARPDWVSGQLELTFPNVSGGNAAFVAGTIALAAMVGAWFFRKRVIAFWAQMVGFLKSYSPRDLAAIFGWSIAFHGFRLLGLYCFLMFYGQAVSLFDLLFVLSIVAFVSILPISIGALGVRENAITWSLALFGVPVPVAVGLALVNRLLFMLLSLFGGLVYLKTQIKIKPMESV